MTYILFTTVLSVLQVREQGLISSTLHSLKEAKKHAQKATDNQRKSLQRMIDFAQDLHHVFDFICTDETSILKIQRFMAISMSQNKKNFNSNITNQNTKMK